MIHVIDDVISDKHSQFIFEKCVKLKWTFVPDISLGSANKNTPGFSHTFFLHKDYNNNDDKTIIAPEYDYMAPVLLECFDAMGLDINLETVFRSRARLTLPRPELPEQERIDNPHHDYSFPHYVLIYYVNTTDGDTLIYENDKIVERVSPKRGRCMLFNGNCLHASSTSTLAPRIIINNNIRIPTNGER